MGELSVINLSDCSNLYITRDYARDKIIGSTFRLLCFKVFNKHSRSNFSYSLTLLSRLKGIIAFIFILIPSQCSYYWLPRTVIL
ncbi:Transmembrane 7 superfamily member [Dirofilaria immitis]